MPLRLSKAEQDLLDGRAGPGSALAMRILVDAARLLGASDLVEISSAHIDGCLYHGDSGTLFAERLVAEGAKVCVPSTLNVGALDLLHTGRERLGAATRNMARRTMSAYLKLGCIPSWTCAPYQAGHRPGLGQDVAWGESNAVVFCNSVLGARSNRYGDFLDICAAITGRAPRTGLHVPENRLATIHVDASAIASSFWDEDIAYPILGAWLGKAVGDQVAAITGMPTPSEDQLKALGAAAASTGAVGLFHVVGFTPEAATEAEAFGGQPAHATVRLNASMLAAARVSLSTTDLTHGKHIHAVAIGSPHLSAAELRQLSSSLADRHCKVPLYACTSRHTLGLPESLPYVERLKRSGVFIVADTCIVVTPILPEAGGILVTNSGKFAHYTPPNTGYDVAFASLEECVESAVRGYLHLSGCAAA